MNLEEKIEKVKLILKGKKVAIAFSGGADSTLIAIIAKEVCNDVLAITFNNGLMPSSFLANSKKIAREIGINQEIINKDLMENESFIENNTNKCFICRSEMYNSIINLANGKGFDTVIDGTNISDLLEDRPGILVNYEKGIKSPLVEAGIEKKDVKTYINELNINYSKITSCLGTRIKTGQKITVKKINRIKYGEELIKSITKEENVRVRDDNGIATIELENIEPLLKLSALKLIEAELKAVSFKKVNLNISTSQSSQNDLVIYQPCKDENGKVMFENEVPYQINLKETCNQLESLGDVKCSEKIGVAMLRIGDKNISIFEKGKIVARRVGTKEDAENLLKKILPLIRRKL
ncbi:MAG: ATP-dependent sacrificial sulfur transferase LarE [Methanobacteriaceae archaeon]